jgi:hypothetical protein
VKSRRRWEGERRTGPALTQITDQLYLETDAVLSPRSRIWPRQRDTTGSPRPARPFPPSLGDAALRSSLAQVYKLVRRCASTYPHHVVTLRALAHARAHVRP